LRIKNELLKEKKSYFKSIYT
jgi:hypothetical protein